MEKFDISIWKARKEKQARERENRRLHLLEYAKTSLPPFFHKKQGINQVFITGSLIQPGHFHKFSDIDIAVQGLPESDYLKTKMQLEELLDCTVDLIEMENCKFATFIEKYGQKIL